MSKTSQMRRKPNKNNKKKIRDKIPSLAYSSLTDFTNGSLSATSTTTQTSILTAIQSLLASYPQHATPVYQGALSGFKLRQQLYISHLEVRIQMVGAQSTTLLSADLYNSIRYAIYMTGKNFSSGSYKYLNDTVTGGILDDIKRLYVDKVVSLPSQAFDSVNSYNVPQVVNLFNKIPIEQVFNFYSLTPSGTSTWDTEERDLLIDFVSDSSVTPHPLIQYNIRIFFSFLNK
jgi:hypothetical protein